MKKDVSISGDVMPKSASLPRSLTLQSVRDETGDGVLGDLLVIPEGLIFLAAPKEAARTVPGEESGVAWTGVLGGSGVGIGTLPEPWNLLIAVALGVLLVVTDSRRRRRHEAAEKWRHERGPATIARQVSEDECCWWLRPKDITRIERRGKGAQSVRIFSRDGTVRDVEVDDPFLRSMLALHAARLKWPSELEQEKVRIPVHPIGLRRRGKRFDQGGALALTPSSLLFVPTEGWMSGIVVICAVGLFWVLGALFGDLGYDPMLFIIGTLITLFIAWLVAPHITGQGRIARRVARDKAPRPKGTLEFQHGSFLEAVISPGELILRHPRGDLHFSGSLSKRSFERQFAAVMPVREEKKAAHGDSAADTGNEA